MCSDEVQCHPLRQIAGEPPLLLILLFGCETWTLLADSEKRIQAFETNGAEGQQLGVEQDQLPCGLTDTSSGKYQEMETHMVQACHAL